MKTTACLAFLTFGLFGGSAACAAAPLELRVLSSRPDMVTGEDALVAVRAANPGQHRSVHVRLNGQDVTSRFKPDAAHGDLVGLVNGLHLGDNQLEAALPGAPAVRLHLVDHSINGPIFSGPHMTPFECRTEAAGLGPATDSDCNAPTHIRYFYKTTAGKFLPLPEGAYLPGDIATVTAGGGASTPYVVRVESGVINRAVYRFAVLAEPPAGGGTAPALKSWKHRLVIRFGGGCGVHYTQGANDITQALSDLELSRGYAFMDSPTLVNQQFCNPALQGETVMMLKEHIIKTYGPLVWTAGVGESGGAIQQYEIAQMYPGLLDGLQTDFSFPDDQLQAPMDSERIRHAFEADPVRWTDAKKLAVTGETPSTFMDWHISFGPLLMAVPPANIFLANMGGALKGDSTPCGVSDSTKLYDPKTNPKGVRCSVYDGQANLLGRAPDGRVRRPFDNVGIQYGLAALNAGKISAEDFVILNETVGGFDPDGTPQAARTKADPIALHNAYAKGVMNSGGGGLGATAILNQRSYVDTVPGGAFMAIHDRTQDLIIRGRLARANGDADNQVIWTHSPRAPFQAQSLDLMSAWLDAIAADPSPLSHAKVVRLKPRDATDTCWGPKGEKAVEPVSATGGGQCNAWYPFHSQPRLVAGEPATADVMKCTLKPLSAADYTTPLTAEQLRRLRAVFPTGVCDYRRPGQEQGPFTGAVDDGKTLARFTPQP